MMALLVKVVKAEALPGGMAVLLCDDQGDPLPQISAVIRQENGEFSTIEVRLLIDGENVRFER